MPNAQLVYILYFFEQSQITLTTYGLSSSVTISNFVSWQIDEIDRGISITCHLLT